MADERAATPPTAAAGDARGAPLEPYDAWASRQRRRAALDGAWRVEVTERSTLHGVVRSVTTWHDQLQQKHQPQRQVRAPRSMPTRQQQPSRRAMGTQQPQQPTVKQRRSRERSAAYHKQQRVRALRRVLLVVRLAVRLWRRLETERAACALRATASPTSPSKRRHSPPAGAQLLLTGSVARSDDAGDAALPPSPKRGLFTKGFLLGR